jgi:P-type Ca2+ transporter type 2C
MNYHAKSVKEVISELGSNVEGLSKEQVRSKLKKHGLNKLKKIRQFNSLKVLLSQFKSFLIIVLIFAAVLAFFMHSAIDSIVILVIVALNTGIGFTQEYKAEKAIEALKKIMVPEAKVLRNGRVVRIHSQEIVPGDILILSEGDKIMADARILKSDSLKINEAPLTGESIAVDKRFVKLSDSVPLPERVNMVYQGTQVVFGGGRAIVINTGMKTELGKISELVQEVKAEQNPFKEKLDTFAKKLGIFILIISAITIGLMILEGAEVFQSFLVGVSLAVSAIPEGLPAVIALGLAFATRRMLKKNVLVRKLSASETLGRTTVICVDKTGTLTEEKMKVSDIYVNGKMNSKNGVDLLLKIGILCNNARLEKDENGKEYFIGDPTEKALIISAKNNSLNKKEMTEKEPQVREFAFSSERKMMSIIRKNENRIISYTKGAPEKIIRYSNYELINNRKIRLSDVRKEELIEVYGQMAKKGLRVLGFAYKEVGVGVSQKDAETGLVFVGFQGMIDPPRPEVKNAIKLANQAGIKVIMITGDAKLTADAVAEEIGLYGKSMSSRQLNEMGDTELFKQIKDVSIFSRISPEDKLRIINVLKKRNEVVAMTGDGVNDALALKRADIGIAMGIRGTDVARDSSDIILRDDNFASIIEGVKEGRRVYDNVKKFVKFLLSANFSEVALILLVILVWRNPELLPLLPLQILWINLVTDSLPALALSLEPMESDIMRRKPSSQGILNGIKLFILIASIIPFLIYFLFFYKYMADMVLARTMIVTTSVMFQMLLVFSCRSDKSVFKSGMNKWLVYAVLFSIGLHLIVLYTPVATLFGFVALSMVEWYWILGLSFAGVFLVEMYKFIRRKQVKRKEIG